MLEQDLISGGQVGDVLQMSRPTREQGPTGMFPVLLCGCGLGQMGQEVVAVWGSSLWLRAEQGRGRASG